MVDEVTKECPGDNSETSLWRRVERQLTSIIARRCKPGPIVSGNGTEFTSTALPT
jgi:putative transposase